MTGNDLRNERKFTFDATERAAVEALVHTHPAGFQSIYAPRFVNNIYLETVDDLCYAAATNGDRDRVKIRIRWYGELYGKIAKPILELKIKHGWAVRKESYPLRPFVLDETFTLQRLRAVLRACEIDNPVKQALPVLRCALLNQYFRNYYLSADRRFRITVDSDMRYVRTHSLRNWFTAQTRDSDTIILELKYAVEHDPDAQSITSLFPARLDKFSKYTAGVDAL